AQRTGARRVDVADGAVAAADGGLDARRLLSRLGAGRGHGPLIAVLVRPGVAGDRGEVLREGPGGARRVAAEDGGDGQVGQLDVGVVGGDGRVVPLLDLLVEDVRDRLGGE